MKNARTFLINESKKHENFLIFMIIAQKKTAFRQNLKEKLSALWPNSFSTVRMVLKRIMAVAVSSKMQQSTNRCLLVVCIDYNIKTSNQNFNVLKLGLRQAKGKIWLFFALKNCANKSIIF